MTQSWMLAVVLAACAARPVVYNEPVGVQSAKLIPVDPDVFVVADADKPMFFAVRSYWLFHDGQWYRGDSVRGPWVQDAQPPWQVRKVDQPYAYVHYRRDHGEQTAKTETLAPRPRKNPMFDF